MAKETPCCPKFDPKPWDEKEFVWEDKPFVKDTVRSFMHIPLNIGKIMNQMWGKVKAAGADPKPGNCLVLAYDSSLWQSDQYMAVTKEVPEMNNVKISGTFLSKVFEGPYKEAKDWYKEIANYAEFRGKKAKKIYFYYTTCPKCAKTYGKNYVVGFAEV